MIVCIPLRAPLADGERDAPVEPHLPRARYLHLYDTEARSGRTLDLSQLGQTESFRIEALLCTSLDRMTLRQLLQRGIRVYGTDAETLLDAIGQFERGELVAVEGESESESGSGSGCGGGGCGKSGGCGGHGHGHAHGEASGGGCGGHAEDEAEHAEKSASGRQGGCGSGGGCGCGGHRAETGDEAHAAVDEAPLPTQGVVRIAVCSQNRKTVTEHAGKCRKFWIYTLTDGVLGERELLELPLEQALHSTPGEAPHPLDGVHVLIAASMGGGMQAKLRARGIAPRITAIDDPDAAVAAFLAGEMPAPETRAGGGCGGGGSCGGGGCHGEHGHHGHHAH